MLLSSMPSLAMSLTSGKPCYELASFSDQVADLRQPSLRIHLAVSDLQDQNIGCHAGDFTYNMLGCAQEGTS